MPYNYLNKINIFNLSKRDIVLHSINKAYDTIFNNESYDGIKPYIEIYLIKPKENIPISISMYRTSRIIESPKYQTSFSNIMDGYNIYLNCYEYVTDDYLSWLTCKCIKRIEVLLNKGDYKFLENKDELSKKRVIPQKEILLNNKNWQKEFKDSFSIEIITNQFAKEVTGVFFDRMWKKEQLKKFYPESKINPVIITTKEAQNLMKTLDFYEIKLIDNYKKLYFKEYYKQINLPENEPWLRDKAWREFRLRQFEEAVITFDQLIKLNQHNEEYHRLKGASYFYLAKFKEALDALNTATFSDSNNPETWYLKSNCFYKLQNFPKTTSTIEKALEVDPENFHYQAVKGLSLFSEKKYDKALKYLKKSLKTNPQQAKAWCLRGFSELYTLEFERALKSFDKTLTIKQNYIDAILGKAVILKRLERYEEALECFNTLQKAKPEDAYIHKCLRECILAINKKPDKN